MKGHDSASDLQLQLASASRICGVFDYRGLCPTVVATRNETLKLTAQLSTHLRKIGPLVEEMGADMSEYGRQSHL